MTAYLFTDEKLSVSGDPEFASIGDKWRRMGRVELEAAADGLESLGGAKHAAKAEMVRRNQEFAHLQMKHAEALAEKQLSAAMAVARATNWAVWAAAFSAGGAVVTAIVEVTRLACGK